MASLIIHRFIIAILEVLTVLEIKIIVKYICKSIPKKCTGKKKKIWCRSHYLYFLNGKYDHWMKQDSHCKVSWVIFLHILMVLADFLSHFDTLVTIFWANGTRLCTLWWQGESYHLLVHWKGITARGKTWNIAEHRRIYIER